MDDYLFHLLRLNNLYSQWYLLIPIILIQEADNDFSFFSFFLSRTIMLPRKML